MENNNKRKKTISPSSSQLEHPATNNKTTSASLDLSHLPDLALIAILDRLPVRALGKVGVICSRWYALQRHVLHCSPRRLTLRIVDSFSWFFNDYDKQTLEYGALTRVRMLQLGDTFRSITSLNLLVKIVVGTENANEQLVAELLRQYWAPQLQHFRFVAEYSCLKMYSSDAERKHESRTQDFYREIFELINHRMPRLVSLYLAFEKAENFYPCPPEEEILQEAGGFPVLAQLCQFELDHQLPFDFVLDNIERHCTTNTKLVRFSLNNKIEDEDEVRLWTLIHLLYLEVIFFVSF